MLRWNQDRCHLDRRGTVPLSCVVETPLSFARNQCKLFLFAGCLFLLAGCRAQPPREPTAAEIAKAIEAQRKDQLGPTAEALYIEPEAGFTWLYTMINNAHQTVDMTMYELTDTTFSGGLVAACGRGVRVRAILDQSLEKVNNTPAYTQLNSAGPNCSAAWSNPQFQATHQKSLIIDHGTAVIMTGNLTSRYYPTSRDFAVVQNDTWDIAAMQGTFNTDYGSTSDLKYQPAFGDTLIWSPTTAEADLVDIISNAKKTLLVENEELAAPSIVNALAAACKQHVKVEMAMTDTNVAYHVNYSTLEHAGCGVHIGANDATTLYIHAKAIVADIGLPAQVAYVGSINFSNASLTENRELGLYVHDPATLGHLSATMADDYAQFPAYK